MKFKSNKVLRDVLIILCVSIFLGIVINIVHPHGVKIKFTRPESVYANDALLAKRSQSSNKSSQDNSDKEEIVDLSEPAVVSTQQVIEMMTEKNAILVDARDYLLYRDEKIPSSINIPFEQLDLYKSILDTLPTNQWLVCYCDGPPCDLGELLAFELMDRGFPMVAIYEEGINAWKTLGNAVISEQGD